MLNTTSMAFSNLSYMTPTRSRARPATTTGRDCAADYFASSADFEYDLFLHGLVTCDSTFNSAPSSTSASTSSGTGFFSRYRSSRPFYHGPASPSPAVSSLHGRQMSSSFRSNQQQSQQQLFNALSITSLNRTNINEPYYQNMLASNLSLNTTYTAGTGNLRPTLVEETTSRKLPQQSKAPATLVDHLETENVDNLSHQQLHALHRFRRQKEKGFLSRLRDVVISFTPKARLSIVNRQDIFIRFGKEEKDALACFDYLDKLPMVEDSPTSDARGKSEPNLVAIDELLSEWQMASSCSNASAHPPSCDTPTTATCSAPATDSDGDLPNKANNSSTNYFDSNSGQASQVSSILNLVDCLGHSSSSLDLLDSVPLPVTVATNLTPRANSGKQSKKKAKQKKSKQSGKSR